MPEEGLELGAVPIGEAGVSVDMDLELHDGHRARAE
jgi:hypothetical protein